MTINNDDSTSTADEPLLASIPQPPSHRLAPLQLRDPNRYEVLGEHGRGGLGTVSRAHDKELGRDVAIKELISRGDIGEIRFLREALITARLEHPSIVPIHEAGRWPDGTPFYVMKLVAGRSLKELIAERETIKERLELLHHVIAVADAVAYVHKRNIIHRDLKASNVIAGDFGETIVIDWGLAKDLTAADEIAIDKSSYRTAPLNDLTATGETLGTVMYMPPEQRRGESVDQRADVFAIGMMLWQLCSPQPGPLPDPYDRDRLLRRSGIDEDLVIIIAKALAPDPGGRYRDAGELAEELKSFKSGARITARHYSLLDLLLHWTRRHRALAVTVSSAVVLAIAGTIAFVANITAERERTERANDNLVLQNAELHLKDDPTTAMAVLAGYRGKDEVQRQRLRAEAEGRGIAEAVFTPHSDTIWFLVGDSDGAVFSLGEDHRVLVTKDNISTPLATDVSPSAIHDYSAAKKLLAYVRASGGIAVLDLKTRRKTNIEMSTPVAVAIAPDGSRLAALDARRKLTVWSLSPAGDGARPPPVIFEQDLLEGTGLMFADASRLLVREKKSIRVLSVGSQQPAIVIPTPSLSSLHARNDEVIIGDETGHITLLSMDSTRNTTLSACHKRVNDVRLAEHAKLVAFACQDGIAGVAHYDEPRKELFDVDTFSTHKASYFLRIDASGMRMSVTADSNIAFLYDIESRTVTRYEGHAGQVSFIATPSSEYDRVLAGDVNGIVRVWKVPPRNARVILRATAAVYGAEFSPDGKIMVTDGSDRIVRRAKIDDGRVTALSELRGHEGIVRRVRFSPDGTSFLSFSNDGTVRVWNLEDEQAVRIFTDHASVVGDAEYIEGGRRIVSAGNDGRLLLWSPRGGNALVLFKHGAPLIALEVLNRSGHIVTHDSTGAVWSTTTDGKHRQIRTADDDTITLLRASPDGGLLAMGMASGTVSIYETNDYRVVHETRMTAGIRQIAFDPQNRDLLIVSEDGHLRLVVLEQRRMIPWRDLAVTARDAAYSSDGETIAFVCGDGGTWFYSLRSSSWAYTRDHATTISSGRFSQDGTHFVSTDRIGTVVVRNVVRTFTERNL